MEALRKAEEAKRKDTEKPASADSLGENPEADVSSESFAESSAETAHTSKRQGESHDLLADFDTALSAERSDSVETGADPAPELDEIDAPGSLEKSHEGQADQMTGPGDNTWVDLELSPIPKSPEPELESLQKTEVKSGQAADLTLQEVEKPAPQMNIPQTPHLEVQPIGDIEPEPAPEVEPAPVLESEPVAELDIAEASAWKSRAKRISNPGRYRSIAFVALLLFCILGGGVFWVWSINSQPAIVPVSDRGFLGGPDPAEEVVTPEPSGVESGDIAAEVLPMDMTQATADTGTVQSTTDLPVTVVSAIPANNLRADPEALQSGLVVSQSRSGSVFSIKSVEQSSELTQLQQEAREAAQAGYSFHAREQYEWLLSSDPNNSEALLALARLDTAEGNYEAAQQHYLRLLELDSTNPLARAGLLSLQQDGNSLNQEAELKSLVSRYPEVAPLSYALGNLLASQQRWNEAEAAYSRALSSARLSNSPSPDYPYNLAVALEQLSKPAEAYLYYLEALEFAENMAPGFDMELVRNRMEYLARSLR